HLSLATLVFLRPDLASHPGDFRGGGVQLVDHDVDRVLKFGDFAFDLDGDLLGEVALRNRRRDFRNVANLGGEIGGQLVDVVGEVLPGARRTQHIRLAAEAALGADLACHAGDLAGKGVQLVDHAVDCVLQLRDLAANVDGDLLGQLATGDGRGDLSDIAYLTREVAGHRVDIVGEVFPGPGRPLHVGLAAQPALGTHLARYARDFRGEGVQLIHHDIDRVLQLEDLALHVDGDLFRQVSSGHRGRDLGDIAHLGGQVASHVIDVVGKVLPNAGDAGDPGLPAELAFRTNLACHPGHLPSERVQLIHHDVDGVL